MSTRSGIPCLREKVSESNTDFMVSQPTLTDMMVKLDLLRQEANAFRLDAKRLKENVGPIVTKLDTYNPKNSTTCVILIIRKVVDMPDSTIPLIFIP